MCEALIVGDWGEGAIARAVDRSSAPGRQTNLATHFELEQQRASGHVFEASGLVAPTPKQAQFTGEPGAVAGRMRGEPGPYQSEICGADEAALDELHWLHHDPS